MADAVDFTVQGLNELLRSLEKADKRVRDAAFKGLQAGAQWVINDAKDNLRDNDSIVTGLLRSSGRLEKIDDETLDVGFFDTTNRGHGYAMFVEFGRRAGKFPPIDEMIQWVQKKLRIEGDKESRTLGFLIARKIAREGSAPHPFFIPSIKKNQRNIVKAMRDAVTQATR